MKKSFAFYLHELAAKHNEAFYNYQLNKYPGKITLFKATHTPRGVVHDSSLGWNGFAEKGIDEIEVEGYHKNILREPNVKSLAEKLQGELVKSII